MWDIYGIYWEAELAYRRERIAEDFRRAGGRRDSRLQPRTRGREQRRSFLPAQRRRGEGSTVSSHDAAAVRLDGGGGGVRR